MELLLCVMVGCLALTLAAPQFDLAQVRSKQELRASLDRGMAGLALGLQQGTPPGNTALSPLSVAAVLALLLAGANGQTKLRLQHIFGVNQIPHKDYELLQSFAGLFKELAANDNKDLRLDFSTALFVRSGQPRVSAFFRHATELYRSEIHTLDLFSSPRVLINRWKSNRTECQNLQLVKESLPTGTSLVVASALYFRGLWEQPFNVQYTMMDRFRSSPTESLLVHMMAADIRAPYASVRGSHAVVGLPFRGGDSFLYLILPENGDPAAFLGSLTPEKLESYLNQTVLQEVTVAMPRMRVEGRMELSGPLTTLGASCLFRGADLSGMGLGVGKVDEVLHRVTLDFTESGTVEVTPSEAFTSCINCRRSTPLFRADSPFIFFIQHRSTGAILFSGTVYRPMPILKF